MSKVFGYPEYDEKGEKILTTYDNEYESRRDKNIFKRG